MCLIWNGQTEKLFGSTYTKFGGTFLGLIEAWEFEYLLKAFYGIKDTLTDVARIRTQTF